MDEESETPQYVAIKKHLQTVKRTYINGSHSTVDELSFYSRFQHKSNNDCENINKMKNRVAKKMSRNGKKTSNILSSFLLSKVSFCSEKKLGITTQSLPSPNQQFFFQKKTQQNLQLL